MGFPPKAVLEAADAYKESDDMRRFALLLVLALPGCADFGDFLGDTASLGNNPNMPVGESENLRRVRGLDTEAEPLRPEAGNVWPTELQAAPTLQDLEREANQNPSPAAPPPDLTPYLPAPRQPRPVPGSSSPPGIVNPGLPQAPNAGVQPQPNTVSPSGATPPDTTVQTQQGSGTLNGPGYKTLTTPQGNAIVVPNGNGTSTVIKPDGSVETIQTPK